LHLGGLHNDAGLSCLLLELLILFPLLALVFFFLFLFLSVGFGTLFLALFLGFSLAIGQYRFCQGTGEVWVTVNYVFVDT
jgi:hypothetical protein